MDSKLEQAKEWARDNIAGGYFYGGDRALAAAEVIQALPDQIVDGHRLRQIIDFQGASISDDVRKDLDSLLAPPLPTLADMTPGGRRVCQWMQCVVETDAGDAIGVIHRVWSRRVDVIFQSGSILEVEHRRVTPLPGEPKLKWPSLVISGENETVSVETEDVTEEPKPGQAWLVEWEGKECEALIADYSSCPWVLHDPEEVDLYSWCDRDEITPIRRLRADAKENV